MKTNLYPFLFLLSFLVFISGCDSTSGKKKKENVAYEYYDNGRIKSEAEVKDDTLAHGLYKRYTPDG